MICVQKKPWGQRDYQAESKNWVQEKQYLLPYNFAFDIIEIWDLRFDPAQKFLTLNNLK